MVQCVPISSLDKELFDSFSASVLLVGLDGEMEWGETFGVSCVQITSPGNDVVESELCSREGSPVERGTFTKVKSIDLKTFLQEVGQADRLVSLGCHV